jgi:hypothetical protein
MRRTSDEHLIERYLSGEMSGAEEEEFFARVAVDSNLRQMLKAYRIMESALRTHRDAISPEHSTSRRRLVLALAARAPQTAPDSRPSTYARMTQRAGITRWITLGIVAAALSAVTVLVNGDDARRSTTTARRPITAPSTTAQPPREQPLPAPSFEPVTAPAEAPSIPTPRRARRSEPDVTPSTNLTTTAASVERSVERPAISAPRSDTALPVRRDTIRMRMRIALPE